jgi:hypothetical protein
MRTRHHAVAALALVAIIVTPVLAGPMGSPSEPLAFVAVPLPSPRPSVGPIHRAPDLDIVDRPVPVPTMSSHPRVVIPPPKPHVSVSRPTGGSSSVQGVRGQASWYCGHGSACARGYPGGLYAAAGPALRVGHWRGRYVVVQRGSSRVTVQLVDWCACPQRVIDLYSAAFQHLGPLSRGVLNVTVSW